MELAAPSPLIFDQIGADLVMAPPSWAKPAPQCTPLGLNPLGVGAIVSHELHTVVDGGVLVAEIVHSDLARIRRTAGAPPMYKDSPLIALLPHHSLTVSSHSAFVIKTYHSYIVKLRKQLLRKTVSQIWMQPSRINITYRVVIVTVINPLANSANSPVIIDTQVTHFRNY